MMISLNKRILWDEYTGWDILFVKIIYVLNHPIVVWKKEEFLTHQLILLNPFPKLGSIIATIPRDPPSCHCRLPR